MTTDEIALYECPICYLIMSRPGRTPMTLECGHTVCSGCLSRLDRHVCPLCQSNFTHPLHSLLLTQFIELYVKTHSLPPDANPPSLQRAVPPRFQCTFAVHGRAYIEQPWFHCRTCNFISSLGCCSACASFCHRGHDVIAMGTHASCFCDCGARGADSCACLSEPPPEESVCTLELTGKCFCEQEWFHCETCGLVESAGCCAVCARVCHAGHRLAHAGLVAAFCDCGGGCRCRSPAASAPHCTFVETRRTEQSQPVWVCRTCKDLRGEAICEHCARTCHRGHIVEERGVGVAFCRCGVKCTVRPVEAPEEEDPFSRRRFGRRRGRTDDFGGFLDMDMNIMME